MRTLPALDETPEVGRNQHIGELDRIALAVQLPEALGGGAGNVHHRAFTQHTGTLVRPEHDDLHGASPCFYVDGGTG